MVKFHAPSLEATQAIARNLKAESPWKSKVEVEFKGRKCKLECVLYTDTKSQLATTSSLASVNWLLSNFEDAVVKAIKGNKFANDFFEYKKVDSKKDAIDQILAPNTINFRGIAGYSSGEVELLTDIRFGGRTYAAQLWWRSGSFLYVTQND